MITQVVILAGGKGTRLGELTKQTPKPLLPVDNKPFLEYLIWNLVGYGVTDIVITTGYLSEQFKNIQSCTRGISCEIRCIQEQSPLGTGGCLKPLEDELDESFFVVNGDSIFDFNLYKLGNMLSSDPKVMAAMGLRRVDDVTRYGNVMLNGAYIQAFLEKDSANCGPGLVNGGIYAMRKDILNRIPNGKVSLEESVFPCLARDGLLAGDEGSGFFLDIGVPESYDAAQKLVPEWKRKFRTE